MAQDATRKSLWVLRDAALMQLAEPAAPSAEKREPSPRNSREEVMRERVLMHPRRRLLLDNLADVWFLEGCELSEWLAYDGEQKWGDILRPEQLRTMRRTGCAALSMALVNERPTFVALDLIESYTPHCGAAAMLVEKLREHFAKPVIPLDVSLNLPYWAKRRVWLCEECAAAGVNPRLSIEGFDQLLLSPPPPPRGRDLPPPPPKKKARKEPRGKRAGGIVVVDRQRA